MKNFGRATPLPDFLYRRGRPLCRPVSMQSAVGRDALIPPLNVDKPDFCI